MIVCVIHLYISMAFDFCFLFSGSNSVLRDVVSSWLSIYRRHRADREIRKLEFAKISLPLKIGLRT
ncbi:hypothetical protein BDL97_15G078500 [Sphagnum fallax]|jgi:hypothetical protein|nr:hypothetical protein BDL97_15G078500 [Sphagnum fallax]